MAPDFGHDPADKDEIDSRQLSSFDEAHQEAQSNEDVGGLGFVMTRHDPFLVLEAINALDGDELDENVAKILDALGESFTELRVDENGIRVMYTGGMPEPYHGEGPVVLNLDKDSGMKMRFYDSGWTPVTGEHVEGTPEDTQPIDQEALETILSTAGLL